MKTKNVYPVVDNYEVNALYAYGAGSSFTHATIDAALAAIGTTNKCTLLLRPGTWVFSANKDYSSYANVTFKLPPSAIISHGAYTVNIPNIEAGVYQIFTGTGAVTLSNVKEIYVKWFWDGTSDIETAVEAALNATSYGEPIPVILPSGRIDVAGTITLPKGAILKGANQGSEVTAANNATYIYHVPTEADIELLVTTTTASNPVHLSDFYIAGSQSSGTSKTGINFASVLRGSIKNVVVYGAFANAAVEMKTLQDVDVDNLLINNQDETTATPAGLLFKTGLSTTVRIKGLYIQGHATSATGGITKGVVCEDDAVLGLTLEEPIIESLTETAFDIDCGNTVDIIAPYTENIPNTDAAYALFNVGLTTPGASYGTYLNIFGGIIGGGNYGYTSNFGFSLGKYNKINVFGTQFQRVYTFQKDNTTDHLGMFTVDAAGGAMSAFGTITNGKNWDYRPNNQFAARPSGTRFYGAISAAPIYYVNTGQIYHDNSAGYYSTYIHTGINYRTFTYNTGSHSPTLGQTLYGETSGAIIIVAAFTNTGGWAGSGTGSLYYKVTRGTPANGEHFHEAASGSGNLVCNTTSVNTNVGDMVGWIIQPGGRPATLANIGTPDLALGTGLVPVSTIFTTGGTTTITDFLNGQPAMRMTLIAAHSVKITDGTTIILAGGADFDMKATDTLTLQYNVALGAWLEIARSVN